MRSVITSAADVRFFSLCAAAGKNVGKELWENLCDYVWWIEIRCKLQDILYAVNETMYCNIEDCIISYAKLCWRQFAHIY